MRASSYAPRPSSRRHVPTALAPLLALGVLLAACGNGTGSGDGADAPATTAPQPPEGSGAAGNELASALSGHHFVAVAATVAGQPKALVDGAEVRLGFDAGQLNGSGGCNSLRGSYRLDSDHLTVGELAMTAMACDDAALMGQDAWLSDLLAAGPTVSLDGSMLVLTTADTELRLTDAALSAAVAATLRGTEWQVTTLFEGESAGSVPQGVEASLRIDGDQLTVNTGCNTGGGSVTVDEAAGLLHLDPIVATQKACGEDAMRVERHLFNVLQGSPMFTLDGRSLRIDAGTGRAIGLTAG